MNIEALFSTGERIRILREIIYRTGPLNVNRVAKEVGLSRGLVSKYLNLLTKEGILSKENGKFLVKNNIGTKAARILLNLNLFDTDLLKKYDFIKGAGLYGSFVKGTNTEGSDIDLWIMTEEASEEALARLTSDLKKTFGDVRPLYLTRQKMELLKKGDTVFYYSLIFGSITIHGEEIEAI